ncbi:dienelactone hydrolase family protein [soil metagenome]
MPAGERTEHISAMDGGSFDAYTVLPGSGAGPGILLLQEIFGINVYIHGVARRVADLGYVVMAPDLYWRIEPHVALAHDQKGVARGMEYAQRFDPALGLQDCGTTLDHLRGLPEVTGRVAVLGFCFGGTLAYQVAARFEPDAAVSYYGSGVPGALEDADRIACPTLFHFGGDDPYIPREQVDKARKALEPRSGIEFHVHEGAGHAFDNHEAPMFHNPDAAAAAWGITARFLRHHLPS